MSWKDHMQETAMAPMKAFLLKSDLFTFCLTAIKSSVGVENSSSSGSMTLIGSICCPNRSIKLSNSISTLDEGLAFWVYASSTCKICIKWWMLFSQPLQPDMKHRTFWEILNCGLLENCKIGERNSGYWFLLIILKKPIQFFLSLAFCWLAALRPHYGQQFSFLHLLDVVFMQCLLQ